MFSLTGIPPLAGFWGKLLVFGGALSVEPCRRRRRWPAMVVCRRGDSRRAERRRGRGLLPADRRRDVLPHSLGDASRPGRRGGMVGRRGLRPGR